MMTRHCRPDIQIKEGITVIRFVAGTELVEDCLRTLNEDLQASPEAYELASPQHKRLLLNLGSVEEMTGPAIFQLLGLNRKVRSGGGQLVLCGLQRPVRDMLRTCKLDSFFCIYSAESQAFQALLQSALYYD